MSEYYLKKELYELIQSDSSIFDFLQHGSLDGMWYWDLENPENEWLSDRFWTLFGVDPSTKEHKASEWQDIIFQEDLQVALENFNKHIEDPSYPYDQIVRYRHSDGSTIWVRCRGMAIRDNNGVPIRMLGAHQDITRLKQIEQEYKEKQLILEETNSLLEKLPEQVPGVIYQYRYHPDGRNYFPFSSSAIWDIYEVTPEEVEKSAQKVLDRLHPDDYDYVMKTILRSFETLEDWEAEYRVILPFKGMIWVSGKARPEKLDDGSVLWHGYITDVTERKELEHQLSEGINRYGGLLENIDAGVVVHAPDTTISTMNVRASELLGIHLDHVIGKDAEDSTWKFLSHDEEELLLEDYPVNIIKRTLKGIQGYIIGIQKDDLTSWVSCNGYPRFNQDNTLKEIVISFFDVTTRHMLHKKLEFEAYHDHLTGLKNRRYFSKLINQYNTENLVPVSVLIGDINGLKLINDAFGHMTGDKVILHASKALQEAISNDGVISRIGGDEFAVVLPNVDKEATEKYVNKINEMSKEFVVESVELSISVGYVTKMEPSEDLYDVIKKAEDNMYRQKLTEIPSMRNNAIKTILNTLYEKDQYSEHHSKEVSMYAVQFAKALGLDFQTVKEIETAALLHDIGKIIIPSSILTKQERLTEEERNIIDTHSEIGFRILNSSTEFRSIAKIVLNIHEHYNGYGYPVGQKGSMIPLESRIIAIVDAYQAMTSDRSYRKALPIEKAKQELIRCSGTQFDPSLVEVFMDHFEEVTHL